MRRFFRRIWQCIDTTRFRIFWAIIIISLIALFNKGLLVEFRSAFQYILFDFDIEVNWSYIVFALVFILITIFTYVDWLNRKLGKLVATFFQGEFDNDDEDEPRFFC